MGFGIVLTVDSNLLGVVVRSRCGNMLFYFIFFVSFSVCLSVPYPSLFTLVLFSRCQFCCNAFFDLWGQSLLCKDVYLCDRCVEAITLTSFNWNSPVFDVFTCALFPSLHVRKMNTEGEAEGGQQGSSAYSRSVCMFEMKST